MERFLNHQNIKKFVRDTLQNVYSSKFQTSQSKTPMQETLNVTGYS